MKRMIACASMLLFVVGLSACTSAEAPGTNNASLPSANANTNANANAATPATSSADAVASDLTAREKQIWDAIKRKDWDAFAAHIADDQVFVASPGVYDKAGTIADTKQLDLTDLSLTDFKVVNLDPEAAVVTYTVNMKGSYKGEAFSAMTMRQSTAWVNRGGKWLAVFHQDTEVKAPPSGQPSPATQPSKAASPTSPATAASPATTPGSDPVSREKWVWDALKRKDYEGFASLLADDLIEVGSTGVYTKAQSIEGVKQFDLSKAAASDFKETKLNGNASLVTYTVKIPGDKMSPDGERQSTIWVNRGGKWLAVFHQGTTIVKPKK